MPQPKRPVPASSADGALRSTRCAGGLASVRRPRHRHAACPATGSEPRGEPPRPRDGDAAAGHPALPTDSPRCRVRPPPAEPSPATASTAERAREEGPVAAGAAPAPQPTFARSDTTLGARLVDATALPTYDLGTDHPFARDRQAAL